MIQIQRHPSIKDMTHPFTYDVIPGNLFREKTQVAGLPELRAAIKLSAISLDTDLARPVEELEKLKDRLQLAKSQWTALSIFVDWYEKRGQNEFVIVDVKQVRAHVDKIDVALSMVDSIVQ